MVVAVVRSWDADEGWGVLDSSETPDGCWGHYSNIEMDGYRTLAAGQRVDLEWERPGQDGWPFRATRIVPLASEERFHGGRLEVDGEVFEVTVRDDSTGQYDVRWLSGKNPGYGFSARRSDRRPSTREQVIASIRGFLTQVDPTTGYIE